jgi:anti-sigma-K factor RskA
MNLSQPDRARRLDALAAQYALGTLSAGARRRLAKIAAKDRSVGAAMRDWELRLGALADGVQPVVPAPRVWEGICKRLGLTVADAGRQAPTSWWTSLSLWRGLALAGFALAFALATTLLAPPAERTDERIVVVLAGQDQKPAFIASAERGGRFLTVKAIGALNIPAERALELWALPDGKDPRSLGVISTTGVARVPLGASAGVALQGVPALAVSVEPPGGSPTGKPTGPVICSGAVQYL